MKRIAIIYAILLAMPQVRSQTYYDFTSSGNTNITAGSTDVMGNYLYLGASTYNVSGPAQFFARADKEIHLQQGLHVTPDQTSGFAHFYIDGDQFQVVSFHPQGFTNIPTYSRFELGLKLPTAVQDEIDLFLNTFSGPQQGLNPYDPDQIKIVCDITCPNAPTLTRYGFYYQPYSSTSDDYYNQGTTDFPFRIRFAPPEAGAYSCNISVIRPNLPTLVFNNVQFSAVNSGNPGHLNIVNGTPSAPILKLGFANSKMFYGLGQNFTERPIITYNPFSGDYHPELNPGFDKYLNDGAVKCSPATQQENRSFLNDLADKGGNFARIRLDPWNYPLEYADVRTSGVQTYDLDHCITNYQHNQMFLWEFDKTLAVCEDRQIYIMLNVFLDQIFISGTGLNRWDRNPYNLLTSATNPQPDASFDEVKNFFTTSLTRETFKKQLYYIAARWGYSPSIGMWEMINETENTNGYKNPPSGQTFDLKGAISSWVCDMAGYLKSFSPLHLATNGTTGDGFNQNNPSQQNCLDILSENFYSNEIDNSGHYQNNKEGMHAGGTKNFNDHVPFVYGETGLGCMCGSVPGINGGDFQWTNVYNDRNFHNNAWVSAVNGNIATALVYFDPEQKYVDHRGNFRALRKFTDKVKWQKSLKPMRYNDPVLYNSNVTIANGHILHNFYMMDTVQRDYVVGWSTIHPSFWTFDMPDVPFDTDPESAYVLLNKSIACVGYNDPQAQDYNVSPNLNDAAILIKHMSQPNTWYKLRIFDPYDPLTPTTLNYVQSGPAPDNNIALHLPFYNHRGANTNYVGPDRAYIIYRSDEDYEIGEGDQGPGGTSFPYGGNLQRQSGENNTDPSPVIPDELIRNNNSSIAGNYSEQESLYIRIFPNPANNVVNVIYNKDYFTNAEISIFDLSGKLIRTVANTKQLDVRDLDAGMYMVTFKSDQYKKSFKVTITR